MIKCFLSHSSEDKGLYVEIVASKLEKESIIYDTKSFEEGMPPLDEILRGLNQTGIFVLFLSDSSLNKEWVKREIIEAKKLHENGKIKQIYPIIIDKSIDYKDPRIPDWLRDSYNLKQILRPTVAARRIKQRMRELSWDFHPRLKEREDIFVGRNELISSFELRIDDFAKKKPNCIIASGIEGVGRKAFLKRAFKKSNIINPSYEFPSIFLSQHESIEDFLIKIYDFGFSIDLDLTSAWQKTHNFQKLLPPQTPLMCKVYSPAANFEFYRLPKQ
ncbi:MAG: hypothetical protein VR65_10705 [Desulfobulbaceae bacterium BRH_c16a]|nr:MAG: hypothetical protein VR65_10705 [Desulfobulbaceae bacterium BRH_c16a]